MLDADHPDYWAQRWQRGETGWHLADVHPKLKRYWPTLNVPAASTVFVPLCGKTRDIGWLLQQHTVIANEYSETAVKQLFSELNRVPDVRHAGDFVCYCSGNLTVWVGDYFLLKPEHVANAVVVYDRAAYIALPNVSRQRYLAHLFFLLPHATHLLFGLEYDQQKMSGPPFSISETELRQYITPSVTLLPLERHNIIEHEPRFAARGLSELFESVYVAQW